MVLTGIFHPLGHWIAVTSKTLFAVIVPKILGPSDAHFDVYMDMLRINSETRAPGGPSGQRPPQAVGFVFVVMFFPFFIFGLP